MRRARSSASGSGTPGEAGGDTGGGVCMAAMHATTIAPRINSRSMRAS